MRLVVFLFIVLLIVSSVSAQTETPTPTATFTPTPEPYVYATVLPEASGTPGQMTRFDYVITAADVQIVNLLTWQLYSQWAFFLFVLVIFIVLLRRR